MKNLLSIYRHSLCLTVLFFLFSFNRGNAQIETLSSGSFIINMGATNPNTIANGLKPYGLIYDLVRNHNVPVKWVISQTKVKDGVDIVYNSIQYKAGTFIIPAEFRNAAVNARITFWQGQGVVGASTTSTLTVDVTQTIKAVPKWTLDAQNGAIAEGYLINAGVTNTAFPGAYNWKLPAALDCCDDFFVMPHGDPIWSTHGRLFSWNKDCLGTIWAACHATSALENMVNPANRAQQTNFLTQKVAGLAGTSGNYALSNSLILWGSHGGGSVPYIHQFPNDLVSQYLGVTDAAHQNGSEQICVPNQAPTGGWNPQAKIIAYDPTQINVTNPIRPDKTNAAALLVYGRGFDDPTRGFVMYEPAHSHNKGSVNDVAAQRAFWNFSFFQILPKAPNLTVTGVTSGQQVTNGNLLNLSVSATSPLAGITFSYQWSSTCGGTFSAATSANTTFNPPTTAGNCVVSCIVTDNCGRVSFQSFPVVILPAAAPPTVVNDVANLSGSCSPGTSVTLNVLTNDVPNTSSITFTSLNQGAASPANAGTWTSDGNGNVTFTPNPNFNGAATITYTVTNTQNLTNTATITVNVGSTDVNGCTTNQVYAPSEVNLITLETGSFVSQSGTTATVDELSFDDYENVYSDNNADFVNFGTNVANNLIMAIGSTAALRAKDTINIFWSKSSNATATMSVQIGQSAAGPWTNAQTFTNAIAASGTAGNIMSEYIIPNGVSGITHIRLNAGTLPSTNSGSNVWVDAVEYEYLTCVSKVPVLTNDVTTVLEDVPFNIDVLANDNDPQGLALTVSRIVTQPANGKVSINLDGTITYLNTTDIATATSFVYEACNTQGYCSTATVNIIIAADGCGAGSFRANPPGGAVTKVFQRLFAGTNAATANATATNFLDSKLNQASAGNDNYGADSRLEVGKVFSATAALRDIFQFNISEIPTTAIVQNATFSAYRPGGNNDVQTVNLHGLTESFVENQVTWTIRSTGTNWGTAGGSFGAVISSAILNGTKTRYNWDVKSLVDTWVATPANNFGLLLKTGETLNKSHQINTKEIGTLGFRPGLSITYVIPEPCAGITNRAPLAQPDYATTVNGQAVTFNPLPNDADVDAGNTFTITGVSGITAGSATFTANSITYTANISASVPRTERLTYTITDNNGATDQAYVYITVTNAPPTANKDLGSTNSGTLVSIPVVTSNDNDPEGGSLTAPTITTAPKNGTATVVGNNIEYTPGPGFTGLDTLVYQLCETAPGSCSPIVFCDTALVVITVNNLVPVANNDNKNILPCYTNTITLITNDTDPENGVLTVTNLSALSNPLAGILVNNNDGTVTFNPAVGYTGTFTFTYTVTDNGVTPQVSPSATVSITVQNPVNTAPVAVNDAESTNMDQKLYYSVRDNDSDPENHPLTIPTITVAPLHGTAVVNPTNGQVEYTPNPGYSGIDVLTYQICDIPILNVATCSSGQDLCATATLTITIDAPNTVIAINDENSTWINTPVSGATLTNDFDPQGDNPISFNGFIIGGLSFTTGSQTVSGFDATGTPVLNAGSLAINTNGTYTFTPANNFTGVVIVPYSIQDANQNIAYDTANLRITVNPIPTGTNSVIANNDEITTLPNTTVSSTLFTNDRDPQGNSFTVTTYQYDNNGDGIADQTGTIGAAIVVGGITTTGQPVANAGTLTINADGTYTFVPAADFSGVVDVPYTITDALGATSTAILHIDILPDLNGLANDRPQPGDDFVYTAFNTPANSTFISNDTDPNANPVSLNGTTINTGGLATPIGGPVTTVQGGTVQFFANGTYTYTPPIGYSGPDRVIYQLCDVTVVNPQPLCANATIHMLVSPSLSTLPATGLRAIVSQQGTTATIKWETLSEQNTDYFILERSIDNINFTPVGLPINAAGNSTTKNEYMQTDNINSIIQESIIYYRVKLSDIDGKIKYSNIVVLRLSKTLGITAWPNPFITAITINITTSQHTELKIQVTDMAGRKIITDNQSVPRGLSQVNINKLDQLANGIYMLEVTDKNSGNRTVYKLIKEQ
jgi:Bacterial Ig domain/Bacterial cadherin-like domain/Secretion system C-terminal sorting domain